MSYTTTLCIHHFERYSRTYVYGLLLLAFGGFIQGCSKAKTASSTPTVKRTTALSSPKKKVPLKSKHVHKKARQPARKRANRRKHAPLLLTWWSAAQTCSGRTTQIGSTRVTTWKENQKAALSFTYDDAMPCQYLDIYPIQKRYGFKATFFLYTRELLLKRATRWGQSIRNWPHWRRLQAEGNEMGSHSISHPHLGQIPLAKARKEVFQSCKTIRKYVPRSACNTIAYPYGESSRAVRAFTRKHYIAARQAKQGINPPNPPDMMNIRSVIPYGTTSLRSLERRIQRSIRKKGWTVWMFHGTKGQGWEPLPLKRFEAIFRLVKRYQKNLWVGTFGAVAKYIRERQTARIRIVEKQPTHIQIQLTHTLDARYDQALTLETQIPAGWKNVEVRQGTKVLRATLHSGARCTGIQKIRYTAQPNKKSIYIRPKLP